MNTKIQNIGVGERLAAAVDAMQTASVSVSVKDVRIESFLSNLLFGGIDSELQTEGFWVEGKETIMRCDKCGWDGDV